MPGPIYTPGASPLSSAIVAGGGLIRNYDPAPRIPTSLYPSRIVSQPAGNPWAGPTVVDVAGSAGSAASFTVFLPTLAAVGQTMLVWISQNGGQPVTVTCGAAAVPQVPGARASGSSNTATLGLFSKVLDAADITAGSVVATFGASQRYVVSIQVISGPASVDVVGPTTSGSGVTTTTITEVIPTLPNELIMGGIGGSVVATSVDATWTWPGPLQPTILVPNGIGAVPRSFMTLGTQQSTTAVQSGPDAPVASTPVNYISFRVAIKPVSGTITFSHATQDDAIVSDVPTGGKLTAYAVSDGLTPGDVPTGGRLASGGVVDGVTVGDTPTGARSVAHPVVDGVAISDVSTGIKRAVRSTATSDTANDWASGAAVATVINHPTADSPSISDVTTGRKIAVRATTSSSTVSDASTGGKIVSGAVADQVTVADVTPGRKVAVRSTVDGTTPNDRPNVGSKLVARATQDAVTAAETLSGRKTASGATSSSTTESDFAFKGFFFAHSTATSTTPSEALSGRKLASGGVRTDIAPSDRLTGSKTVSRVSVDTGSSGDWTVGRKIAVRAVVDVVVADDRSAGLKIGRTSIVDSSSVLDWASGFRVRAGATRSSITLVDWAGGFRVRGGGTRSSTTPNDWTISTKLFRDITVTGGRLGKHSGGRLVPELVGSVRNRNRTGRSLSAAPEGGIRGHP